MYGEEKYVAFSGDIKYRRGEMCPLFAIVFRSIVVIVVESNIVVSRTLLEMCMITLNK